MPSNTDLLAVAKRRLYPNYKPAPFVLVRGKGCELFDLDDERWLDLCAGVAVCSVGHAHPALSRVIAEQAATLMHTSNYFYNEPNILLAVEITRRTGMDRAFFCNSGTEANEACLKLARHHFFGAGQKERTRIIAFHNAFHGRTLGALSMTGTPKYREGFGELGPVTHVTYGNLDEVKRAMGPDVAAIMVEPLQGEGGVFPAPPGFLKGLRALCDESGALLLLDEVQTGLGRLGKFLGIEGQGIQADVIALAKGLGGGFPIGAMLTLEKYAGALPPGTHGSTFGGNPLASAAALAVLKILDDEKLVSGAKEKGEALGRMLGELVKAVPTVCESARGEGLLWGLVLKEGFASRDVLVKVQENGVLLTAAGERVLRFSPPLVVTVAELEEGVRAVRLVCEELAAGGSMAVKAARAILNVANAGDSMEKRRDRASSSGSGASDAGAEASAQIARAHSSDPGESGPPTDVDQAPPTASLAPTPARLCPGCAKPVDSLRAGQVAIFDGVFLYYCNATCKALHLRAVASHLGDDVPTLDPPAVAERLIAHAAAAAAASLSGPAATAHNGTNGDHGRAVSPLVHGPDDAISPAMAPAVEAPTRAETKSGPAFPSPSHALSASRATRPETTRSEARSVPVIPSEPAPSTPPRTLRSTVPPPEPALQAEVEASPTKPSPRERARSVVSVLGGTAGVLVPLLVIANVGLGARLLLAVVAAGALVARLALSQRDLADASPLLVGVPVIGTLAVAITTYLAAEPRAAAIAVLAGLSASIAIAVEEAIQRARGEVDDARRRIAAALDVPSRVLRGDGPSETLFEVKSGETVLVEPGDIVGVDGAVSKGEALVVPWHGAPIEMQKGEGDAIVAGARVVSGRLRIVTAWAGTERAWARATSSATARADVSAPIVKLTRLLFERAAPAAALVAALAAMASGGAAGWLDAVAAACAVGVALGGRSVVAAVALVHARAQMRALAHGVVYRDAKTFDAAGRAATAVACSRGTVLTGEPEIVALEKVGESAASESRILALAAGAETASTHPLANAILRAARTRHVRPESVRSATVHSGLGVTALVSSGERLVVGSRALLLQEQVSVAIAQARASELEAQGRSVLLVAIAGKLVGLVALQDGLRAGARAAIQRLLDARIEPVLLSGESRETCETIARALEIDHVRPEVLPADRGAEVRALAEGGHVIAVIGHPASDDGALGAADVAVAMGAPTGEWGVWLASDDVRDAALALSTAHAARDRARGVLAAGVAPGVVALLALAFGVGPLVCGPMALALGAALCLGMARRT